MFPVPQKTWAVLRREVDGGDHLRHARAVALDGLLGALGGDSFSLCVTAQCPEEAIEGNGARMAEMVASIAFVA